jgi:hypothetical protein
MVFSLIVGIEPRMRISALSILIKAQKKSPDEYRGLPEMQTPGFKR